MTYTIQFLANDGEWYQTSYQPQKQTAEDCESTAKWLSELGMYENVPIRTIYGESNSPVSVYVDGFDVRESGLTVTSDIQICR